jgi:hypothetical protein
MATAKQLPALSDKQIASFWKRVERRGPSDCWNWTLCCNEKGYGIVQFRPHGTFRTHRVAFELSMGRLDSDKILLHSCDNPRCCNPAHLKPGTDAENTKDMISKGRDRKARGEDSGRAKIKTHQVLEIRRLDEKGIALTEIAKTIGVSTATAFSVARRRTWRHL